MTAGPRDVVLVGATRTPIGRGGTSRGIFKELLPHDLLAAAYRGVLDQTGVRGDQVDEVLTGCVQQVGPQGTNIARNAWLHADLPVSVPASTVDTQCGASQQAVREITPVTASVTHRVDQGVRPGTTLDTLAQLEPPFAEDGRLTAGTSSQVPDGASAVLLMSSAKADELGVTVRARLVDRLVLGDDPRMMLTAPIPLTRKLLQRNRMSIGDLDVTEINEAFASVVLAWLAELEPAEDTVNARGGGHRPRSSVGCLRCRLVTTLVHELEDPDAELGLVTMCCAGGLATGTPIQRV